MAVHNDRPRAGVLLGGGGTVRAVSTAIVTGAGSGIGRECVLCLSRMGMDIAACDLDHLRALETVAMVETSRSVNTAYDLDVRDAHAVASVFGAVWKDHSDVDVLVNAAGVYPSDPLLSMGEVAWDRVMDTNLKGPFLTTSEFARRRGTHGGAGAVVNISSGASGRARRGAAHYCASKAGLDMLTRAQALELADLGIRVNAVSPGLIDTRSQVSPLSEEYVSAVSLGIPLGRIGTPQDVAEVVAFLCGRTAQWITGSIVTVDGGSSAGDPRLPLSG